MQIQLKNKYINNNNKKEQREMNNIMNMGNEYKYNVVCVCV